MIFSVTKHSVGQQVVFLDALYAYHRFRMMTNRHENDDFICPSGEWRPKSSSSDYRHYRPTIKHHQNRGFNIQGSQMMAIKVG